MRHPGNLRRWPLRRRRYWTGVLAGAGTAALVLAALHVRPASSAVLNLSSQHAWLVSTVPGVVSDISGSAAAPDASVSIPGMRDHQVSVSQGGATVLVADRSTGAARLISASELTAGKAFSFGPAGSALVRHGSQAYAIDRGAGTITYLSSLPPVAVSQVAGTGTGVGDWVMCPDGTLWVTEPARGVVVPIRDGKAGPPVPVGHPHDHLVLTATGNSPVVADPAAGVIVTLSAAGGRMRTRLPFRGSGLVSLRPSAAGPGPWVAFAAPSLAELILADPQHSAESVIRLAGGRVPLGQPVITRGRVYLGDGPGHLLVYSVASRRLLRSVLVQHPAGMLDIFAEGGLVWANDPAGPDALVIDGNTIRTIRKYQPGGPQPAHPRPASSRSRVPGPSPGPAGRSGAGGAQSPGGPLSITVSPGSQASVGQSLRFRVSSSLAHRRISAARWVFGDSSAAAGVTVSHRWARTGVFTVTVSVTWSTGGSAAASASVQIQRTPPAGRLRCGSVITTSVTLTRDLRCRGVGLLIAASGVTLNLGGHTVTGRDDGHGTIGTDNDPLGPSYRNITIRNGTVNGDIGLYLARHALVEGIHATSFVILGSPDAEVAGSRFTCGGGTDSISNSRLTITGSHFDHCQIFESPGSPARLTETALTIQRSSLTDSSVSVSDTNPLALISNQLIRSPVSIGHSLSTRIEGNTIDGARPAGVTISFAPGAVITGNTFTGSPVGLEFELTSPGPAGSMAGSVIQDNVFTGNGAAGVFLDLPSQGDVRGSVIAGNKFVSNGDNPGGLRDSAGQPVDNGLHIRLPPRAPTLVVKTNDASGNAGYGIYAVTGSVVDGGGNTSTPPGCAGVSCP